MKVLTALEQEEIDYPSGDGEPMAESDITCYYLLEVTSETTQETDQEIKPDTYKKLGVTEYFQYDPSGDYLNPILQGVRLVNGEYESIAANNLSFDTLWLYSEVLELELHLISGELRFRNPETGEFLRTIEEEQEGRQAAELAFQQSEQALLATETALRSLVSQLLNSGMNLAQIAQMMNLPIAEVQQLIGENE